MPSVRCDCIGTCKTNSCTCKKHNRKCGKSCHLTHSTKCKNKRNKTKKRASRKNRKSRKL
uniref:Uncharacterized protein n=1 Tax=viral metagenome TaxID=1070528 RepID=A0A6C0HP24_9ZZZZ